MNGHLKKRALSLLLVLLLSLMLPSALGETFPYVGYATDSVRLRARPSSSATILSVIRKGDAVLITGSDGNYKIVEYEGQRGYVVSAFLSAEPAQAAALPQASVAPEVAANYQSLSSGSTGAAVKALQTALQELGFYSRAIDSQFGSGTAQAVRDFQEMNKLAATGSADAATQHLLFEGAPRNRRGNVTDVKTLPPIAGYTIRPGDRGDAVAEVQQTLTTLKYYSGAIDGNYGSGSQAALKAFQKDNRLAQDGVIGAKTFAALARALQASQASLTPQAPVVTSAPANTPAVYVEPALPEATYPYTTTAAVSVNMRKRASISATRILTVPEGAQVLVLEDSGKYLEVTYRGYTGFVAKEFINIPEQYLEGKVLDINQDARRTYQTLAPGAEGRAVRALQHALAEHGFYNGGVDGRFGSGTTAAVKALQAKNNLRETGIALPELQQLIFEKRVRNSRNRLVYSNTLPPIDGITMTQGDFGDAVYELNSMLVQAKYFDSNAGHEFTRATTLAVRAFQKDHSIKITGKVDAFTLLAIRTAVQAQASAGSTPPPATPEPLTEDTVTVIKDGTAGLAVQRLQQRLVELKYYSIAPDGVFNSDDITALRHFQRVNNLPVTGVADLATQQALFTAFAIGADAQVNQPVQNPLPGSLLKIGVSGNEVRAMQSRLVTLKYLTGNVDGIFGTQTAAAVTAFQRANKLKQDGIAGAQTLSLLYSVNAVANQPAAATPAPQTPAASESLKVGSTGSAVIATQSRLIELKYLTGAADGIYGPRTFVAVKEFQAKNGLESDGIAGRLTLAKLNSTAAIGNNLPGNVPALPLPPLPVATQTPSAPAFTAPRASEVRLANWYTEIRPIASKLRNVIIYDFITGKHYNFRFFSLGKHADGTTLTLADTEVMNSVLGEKNWTARPVWVIFSDGRVYMASTHSHPHENDYISGNGLEGHLCVHFPREMEEAALTGPYAVSHQNAILAGWDLTQNMAR